MTLLTVTQLKEHISTTLSDDALTRLLDAAEEQIIRYAGPYLVVSGADDQVDETFVRPIRGILLNLSRRAASIEEVVEDETTLAADDYELRSSGYLLVRLDDGTNPRHHWHTPLKVTYTPLSDAASREIAQVELVKLDIATNPTLASQTIGSWSETYATNASYTQTRDDILASLLADALVML